MTALNDERVAALAAEFLDWQVWIVPAYIGPTTWCARRRDDDSIPVTALDACGPAELAAIIREREAEAPEAGQ